MKKLLGILVLGLFLMTPSQADDIRDFQVEGMSVRDSILDHYTLSEIKKSLQNQLFYQKSKKFKIIKLKPKNDELYDAIQFHIKDNDKNYIIYAIKGTTYMSLNRCLTQKKNPVEEIKTIIPNVNTTKNIEKYGKHLGNSKAHTDNFYLKSGDMIRVWCTEYDIDNAVVKERRYTDSLNVSIYTKEFKKWLTEVAY